MFELVEYNTEGVYLSPSSGIFHSFTPFSSCDWTVADV